jgi:hypothetical protein
VRILPRLVILSTLTTTLSGLLGAQERLAAMQDSATEYEILSIETKKRCNAKERRQGPRRNLW